MLTPLQQVELVGRLGLAAGVAGVLGWERQLGQQPAGLRTHMLVSLGACAFTMAGTIGVSGLGTVQDAGRIAAQIVTGIGFIGAGAIWRSAGNERVIRGLTTAASIWVAAAIGMLCGYGLYVLAAGCAVVSFVVLRMLRGLERLPGAVWNRLRPGRDRARDEADEATDGEPSMQEPASGASAFSESLGDDSDVSLPHAPHAPHATAKRGKRKRRKKRDLQDQIAE